MRLLSCILVPQYSLLGVAMAEQPRVMTVDEVAELLRLSRRTVIRLLETGKLRGARAGRVWRIPRESVEQFLRGEQQGQGDNS